MIWFEFAVCLGIVLFAGTKLAQYGDIIAEKTGQCRLSPHAFEPRNGHEIFQAVQPPAGDGHQQ